MRVFTRPSIFLLLAAWSCGAAASSCIYPPGSTSDHVRREYAESTYVFSAQVAGATHRDVHGVKARVATLRIEHVWKGELSPGSNMDVIADQNYLFWGSGFEAPIGSEIIVFASPWRGMVSLSGCSLTGHMSNLHDQVPLLDSLGKDPG